MRIFVILILLLLVSCKSAQVLPPTDTIDLRVGDTLIEHSTVLKTRPVYMYKEIKGICRDSVNEINETLKTGDVTVNVRGNVRDGLKLEVKVDSSSTSNSSVAAGKTYIKTITKYVDRPVPKPYIPKWGWYLIVGASVIIASAIVWLLFKFGIL
jgi:hypothetical protein